MNCLIHISSSSGFSLAHKNVHFDPFWSLMTPKTVQGDGGGRNVVSQNSQILLFLKVHVPKIFQQCCQNVPQELPAVGHWSPKFKLRGKTLSSSCHRCVLPGSDFGNSLNIKIIMQITGHLRYLKLGLSRKPHLCRIDPSLPSVSPYMLLYFNLACVELGYDENSAVLK